MSVEKEQFEKVMGELRLAGVPAGTADVIQAFVDAQGAALSRLEAEAGRLAEAGLSAHVKATTMQAQLAEAVNHLKDCAARLRILINQDRHKLLDVVAEEKATAFLARVAEAERQEGRHENA